MADFLQTVVNTLQNFANELGPMLQNVQKSVQPYVKNIEPVLKDAQKKYAPVFSSTNTTAQFLREDASVFQLYYIVTCAVTVSALISRRGKSVSPFYYIFLGIFATFLGDSISSVLTKTTTLWLKSSQELLPLLVATCAVCLLGGHYLVNFRPVKFFLNIVIVLASVTSLTAGYALGLKQFSSIPAAILFATVKSSSSGSFLELEKLFWGNNPGQLEKFWGLRNYLFFSIVYAVMRQFHYPEIDAFIAISLVALLWEFIGAIVPIDVWAIPEIFLSAMLPGSTKVVEQKKVPALQPKEPHFNTPTANQKENPISKSAPKPNQKAKK